MPYDPGEFEDEATIQLREHHRRMKGVHKLLDAANERVVKLPELEQRLATAEAKAENAPDAAKAAKRLERSEKEREEAQTALASLQAETATKDLMVAVGIIDPDDMDLVRHKHSKAGDGVDFARWLEKDAKEDKHLASLFGGEETDKTDTTDADTATTTTKKTLPRGNNQVKQPTSPGQRLSTESIAAMTYEQKKERRDEINTWYRDG